MWVITNNKGNPLTVAHFDDFLRRVHLDPHDHERTSPCSWTVDLEARREAARVTAAPLQQRAGEQLAEADALSKTIAKLKARMTQIATMEQHHALLAEIAQQEERQKQARKQARTLQNEAQALPDTVYDLKAVNPHAVDADDTRTPDELLTIIEETQQAIGSVVCRTASITADNAAPRVTLGCYGECHIGGPDHDIHQVMTIAHIVLVL